MKKIILFTGLLAPALLGAQSDTAALSFSLSQAVDYAMQHQTDVQNALLDEQVARQKVREITGLGLPQINSSLDVKDFVELPTSFIPAEFFGGPPGSFAAIKFGTQYQATGGFDASQLLFSGEYFLGLKASKTYEELSKKATQRTRMEVSTTVSKAYYTVLINQERMALLDANLSRLKKILDDTRVMNENGLVEKLDLDRLQVTYNNLLVEHEKVSRLLEVGLLLLKYQMGMDIQRKLTLTDKLADVQLTPYSAQAAQFDYAKRIEYGLFETQFKLAKLDLKRNRVAYLPVAVAYGSLQANAQRNDFDVFSSSTPWYPVALIGGKVSMPIFTGLQRHAKTQQAKIKMQQAENNLEFIRRSIDLELASTATVLQNATVSFENQRKNIRIAEEVARVAKIKYDQGVGSNLELITAETALKEATTNYYNALFDAIIARIDFDKAQGTIK